MAGRACAREHRLKTHGKRGQRVEPTHTHRGHGGTRRGGGRGAGAGRRGWSARLRRGRGRAAGGGGAGRRRHVRRRRALALVGGLGEHVSKGRADCASITENTLNQSSGTEEGLGRTVGGRGREGVTLMLFSTGGGIDSYLVLAVMSPMIDSASLTV
jgi:hypothetical protein